MSTPRSTAAAPLSSTEALAAASVMAAGAIVVGAYALDSMGLRFTPVAMAAAGAAGGVGTLVCMRSVRDPIEVVAAWGAIVVVTFSWLLWIARPALLPLGSGPDLTHHLLLIRYIEQAWRLVHDAGVEPYLGEMVHYTPGSHILAAVAGAWSRTSGQSALHVVVSAAVALKAGFVFLVAMRMLPHGLPRVPLAATSAISLFASHAFFFGSFVEFSFVAQVVAELFAVAMWWALTAWDHTERRALMALVGLTGAALFLTWPILIGPPLALLGLLIVFPRPMPLADRCSSAAIALVPIAVVGALFVSGRSGWVQIAGTAGKATWPSISAYGWPFLLASSIGLAHSPWRRQTRSAGLFVAAIVAQSAALYWLATRAHNTPYLALKMFYPLLCVQAVGVAMACGEGWRGTRRAFRRTARRGADGATAPGVREQRLAWALAAGLTVLVARPLRGAPDGLRLVHRPALSRPLAQAGEWARAHVPTGCVDYLVGDPETAYWLHLAVLGNRRMSSRTGDDATYELQAALVRWLSPDGLPYAIADLPALPREIREELDIVARFGTGVVARRRGPSSCPEGR